MSCFRISYYFVANCITMRVPATHFLLLPLFWLPVIPLPAQDPSTVEWGRPVEFDDFESIPDPKDTAAANISVTILLGYANERDGALRFKVVAVMDKEESWMKAAFRNAEVLRHEQGHFDIAHIYAKKLEAYLKTRRFTVKDVGTLNTLYDDYLERMNRVQVRYDSETRGGLDSKAQVRWRKYIEREIDLVAR